MNKTAEIVNLWAAFEEQNPNSDIEDFCQDYLVKKRIVSFKQPAINGSERFPISSMLAKLIGRLMRLNSYYANLALREIGIGGLDEFTYLLTIKQLNQPRKTEVIHLNFHELSSGLLIIDRLKNKNLLVEDVDETDKRSKLLKLTQDGENKLNEAQIQLGKVSSMFYNTVPEKDITSCINLLSPIELIYSGLWQRHKGKTFDEVYELMYANS
jgi:DNA-binding MarR family transcriptional regulator